MPQKSKLKAAAASAVSPIPADAALVLRRFRQIFNAVKAHFQQTEKRSGLGGAKIWALSVIQDHPGIGSGALAKAMDIRPSTASNLLKALIQHELIEVRKSESDRRTVQLFVLPAGKKILKSLPGPHSGVLPDALQRLDPATLKCLKRDLERLTEVLREFDESAAQKLMAEL